MRLILSLFLLLPVISWAQYDLIIRNGRVMDGTGNPWFYADIAIREGIISLIGDLGDATALEYLDVKGKIVTPGFIDIHSHADGPLGNRNGIRALNVDLRMAHNMIKQGVTTLVVNHDGRSPISIAAQRNQLENQGFGPNVVLLVGHNTIRAVAMNNDYRRLATKEEISKMQRAIIEGIQAGAYGISAGLEYVPGRWSNTEEIIQIVGTLKAFGGIYIQHERYSGSDPMWLLPSRDGPSPGNAIDNIRELIQIAKETGVTTCATHIKAKGADFWGVSGAIIQLIETARRKGVEIWADQYPYNTTGSDGNTVLIPDWALDRDRWNASLTGDFSGERPNNYTNALQSALKDPDNQIKFKQDVTREIERRGGSENIILFDHPEKDLIGKSIFEISLMKDINEIEAAIYLQNRGYENQPGGGRLRGFSLHEKDIEAFAMQPWCITASDAGVSLPEFGPVHARFYGTFPRKIAWYAKHRNVISIEHAIRSMTSLPAQFMGFGKRGLLKTGYHADITIFDQDNILDNATFEEPHQYPDGIAHVLVGGKFVVKDEKIQYTFPGKIITLKESFRNKMKS